MTRYVLKTAGLAVVLGLCSGSAFAHDGSENRVVYEGRDSARGVCMSIVYDDVDGLKDAFRLHRSHPLERSHLMYECNSLQLDEFAFTQNAESVSQYLAPKFGRKGTVTIEQVTSINE